MTERKWRRKENGEKIIEGETKRLKKSKESRKEGEERGNAGCGACGSVGEGLPPGPPAGSNTALWPGPLVSGEVCTG